MEFQSISEPGKGKGCHSEAVTESLVTEVSWQAEEEGDHTKMHGTCKAVGKPCKVFSPFTPCPAVTPSFLSHGGDSPALRCAEVTSMPALSLLTLSAVGLVCCWGGLQPVKQAHVASINVLTWLTRWQKAPHCPELSEKRLNWLGFPSWGEK